MPRTQSAATSSLNSDATEQMEHEKQEESEEQVEFEEENDADETLEEEIEYEEVEEEVEEEEEEEEVEEIEEEVEEEEVEEETEGGLDSDERRKHDELLSLPPHGSEVYLGNIPHDASEGDLKSFCESIGEVTQIRIMKGKDSSDNKGYAFVTFKTKELASKAIEDLNNTDLRGRNIKCSSSQAKNKLFIGNVPKDWGEVDLRKVVTSIGPGVNIIELLKDPQNSSRNRGFAFIEYYNHACADYSRQNMLNPEFKLGNNSPTVSWADPKHADSSASSQVFA